MGNVARWALGGFAAVLLAATVLPSRAARRSVTDMPDLNAHLTRWSELHGGFEPAGHGFVGRWLGALHRLARLPARWGVSPNLLSLWGMWCAAACVVAADAGGRWPLAGAALVLANGVFDGLDGAVAVLADRVGRYGRLVDTFADRASDAALLVALFVLGASGWEALVVGAVILGLETTRAAIGRQGRLGRLTPGERPTRLILVGLGLLGAGVCPAYADTMGAVSLDILALVVAVSWVMLLVDLRRSPGR